jgi:thymidylate synthase
VNYGFATGEFLWYYAGKNDLATMLYYNKRMKDFSDDGKTLNSAYGYRMFTEGYNVEGVKSNQWSSVEEMLLEDPDSRRAVLTINRPQDIVDAVSSKRSKDVPCTLSLQFFIRKNRLHLHVLMRSNDVWWGLPYDVFSFTLLQEVMLRSLQQQGMKNLRLGEYHHSAGSMHLYERDWKSAKKVVEELGCVPEVMLNDVTTKHKLGVMKPLRDLWCLSDLLVDETLLREGKVRHMSTAKFEGAAKWMAKQLNEHRKKRDDEENKK